MGFIKTLEKQKEKDYPAVIASVNLESLATGLNSNKAHFIYELLQNAEDAKSNKVVFHLSEVELKFSNDGQEFTESNIEAICRFGYSDKDKESDNIGKFGIGFKSVYSITDTPNINSGKHYFII